MRAGLVKRPEEWKWGSYRATVGEEKSFFLTVEWILSQFGNDKDEARIEYKKFVLEGIEEDFPNIFTMAIL